MKRKWIPIILQIIVNNGGKIDRKKLTSEIAIMVDEGMAYRLRQKDNLRVRSKNRSSKRRILLLHPKPKAITVWSGQKGYARSIINHGIKNGTLVFENGFICTGARMVHAQSKGEG